MHALLNSRGDEAHIENEEYNLNKRNRGRFGHLFQGYFATCAESPRLPAERTWLFHLWNHGVWIISGVQPANIKPISYMGNRDPSLKWTRLLLCNSLKTDNPGVRSPIETRLLDKRPSEDLQELHVQGFQGGPHRQGVAPELNVGGKWRILIWYNRIKAF